MRIVVMCILLSSTIAVAHRILRADFIHSLLTILRRGIALRPPNQARTIGPGCWGRLTPRQQA